ncbi:hypothetical protein VN12_00865 [Pirellula sp. SH-Sr6A]|uniref:endonuclease domain-containing protein n=1 Tax=Pirellula sp. SH-Sr6A TaxID=1632865 RepID=UPI00078EF24E|nr:endonuclease domain-containing protein [Pirellula sp. SH-Sr6A]AMV30634.1 hypothetical protein VN12_00865 [Pirellula sp. SH-Sr6A]
MKRSRSRSKEAIEFAQSQRRTSNEFSTNVWQWIRNRQIQGLKFRREYPIPPYTVDFCCVEQKLIIEIDGESHFTEDGLAHDRHRDRFLHGRGYRVLRIPGFAVIRDGREVIRTIEEFVKVPNPSPPAPLPEAGRGEQRSGGGSTEA